MKRKFFTSFLVSLIIFSSFYGWVWMKISGNRSEVQAIEANFNISSVENIEEGNVIKQVNLDEVLFLLVGVDTKDVSEIQVGKDGATGIRSDTMMLCKVNFKDGSIKIMSLPRDSRLKVKGSLDKLNHAHSYGGMKLLMKTVRDFTNLDVDYYVRVDYGAVKALVNAIGGVDVEITQKMKYHDTTKGMELHIDFEPGMQRLDGDDAIRFLRFRSYKRGDEDRVVAQQYFLTQMIKQVLEPKNILSLPKMFDAYLKYIDTNMDPKIIYQGISLAGKLDRENIETMTIPGYGATRKEDGISYYFVDAKGTKAMIEEHFSEYLMKK